MFLTSCFDFGENWRDGNYAVYWIDNSSEKVLGYGVGDGGFVQRIGANIISVGANKSFISAISCRKTACGYFYIDRKKDHKFADGHEAVYGPFSEKQFEAKTVELGLPNLSVKI